MGLFSGLLGAIAKPALGILGSVIDNNKDKKAQAAQNAYNEQQADPATIREKFEAAGFNPLLGLNGWSPPQQNGFVPSSIGTAVSEAGAVFGSYFDNKAKEKSALTLAEQENQKLKDRLRDATLRPVVGGIFGGGDKPLQGLDTVRAETQGLPKDEIEILPTGQFAYPDPNLDRGAGTFVGGTYLHAPPGWAKGEHIEQEFGENPIISWPYTAAYAAKYGAHNLNRWIKRTADPAVYNNLNDKKVLELPSLEGGKKYGYVTKPEKKTLTVRRRNPYYARQARVAGY